MATNETMATAMISARQAAGVLAEIGASRASARRALLAGVAGPALRLRGSLLYDKARVRALVRSSLLAVDVAEATQTMCFVARVGEGVLTTGDGSQAEDAGEAAHRAESARQAESARRAVSAGWHMAPLTAALDSVHARHLRPIPFIGLVGGFVAIGAEITDVRSGPREDTGTVPVSFTLEAPGPWFDQVAGRHVAMSFRAPWTTVGPPPR